jgi:hypothetical protein
MTIARTRTPETGAIYVEAAIIMPVLLLVVFASLFFLLVAARHFSLQMLASDIAKDISLALDPRVGVDPGAFGGCLQRTCPYVQGSSANANDVDELRLNVTSFQSSRLLTNGCWTTCAQSQYLLKTGTGGMQVNLSIYPSLKWFDSTPSTNQITYAAVGDYIGVQVTYPVSAVLGGGIPMFGLVPDINIAGTAITVLERPSSAAVDD